MIKIFTIVLNIFFFINPLFASNIIISEDIGVEEKTTKPALDPKNTLYIELKDGVVIAELFPSIAPSHVQRIRSLTADEFYDGLTFHRVINGFMAQTGDPTGTGRGGSRYGKLYAEFNKEHHVRGTLSMARASDPNSANSQFFIVTGKHFPELDGQYTVFGRVIEGMEYVDKIKSGNTSNNGMVEKPDIIVKMLTGDMLNNKSLETVKEEMKIINEAQEEELKKNPKYKKKSVLKILLKMKDIDTQGTKTSSQEKKEKDIEKKENKKNSSGINVDLGGILDKKPANRVEYSTPSGTGVVNSDPGYANQEFEKARDKLIKKIGNKALDKVIDTGVTLEEKKLEYDKKKKKGNINNNNK